MKRNGCSKGWTKACIAGLMIAGSAIVRADENDQTWLTATVKGSLNDNLSLKFSGQNRYRDDDHYYRHFDYSAEYKMTKSWSVAGIYRDQIVKSKSGQWRTTAGYMLDINNSMKQFGMELKSRMRFTYFDPHYAADSTTDFRPRFDLLPAKGFTAWSLKPYVADEMMYNFDESNFYRNRLSFGLKFNPASPLTIDLSLMHEVTETNEKWAENWNPCLAATYSF